MSLKAGAPRRLVIVDDYFPNVTSGFRAAEFSAYLRAFPDAEVRSSYGDADAFIKALEEYGTYFPDLPKRVRRLEDAPAFHPDDFVFAYFLNTIYPHVDALEQAQTPFAFQLSPGGGFSLGAPETDVRLGRVLASPQLTYVTATQPITETYLRERFALRQNAIHPVGSGVVWGDDLAEVAAAKRRYPRDKPTLDIGFVAMKYNDDVRAKGYDFFACMADTIARALPHTHFHVVGNYCPDDCDLGAARGRVTFHGVLAHNALKALYRDLDIILSPNVPFALSQWHFDGFPLGSVAEAAQAGVVAAMTDPLNLNRDFQPDRDFILIERNLDRVEPRQAHAAAEQLIVLLREPERLARFAEDGRDRFTSVFSVECQLAPRIEHLRRALDGGMASIGDWAPGWRNALVGAARSEAALELRVREAGAYIAQKEANIADLLAELGKRDEAARLADVRHIAVQAETIGKLAEVDAALKAGQAYLEMKERQALEQASELTELHARYQQAQQRIDDAKAVEARANEAIGQYEQLEASLAEQRRRIAELDEHIEELKARLSFKSEEAGLLDLALEGRLALIRSLKAKV